MQHNVRDYGATGDGRTHDNGAIQQSIDACSAAGGGIVLIPPGRYVCGTIHLKANVELHLTTGATIVASEDLEAFPALETREDRRIPLQALIFADKADHAAITGNGVIDGNGSDTPPTWHAARELDLRPAMVLLRDCRHVRVRDVTLQRSKSWTLHLLRCDDAMIRGVTIRNNWPNSDGIDPDGCRRMVISDCDLDCGDDCIVIKSTKGDVCDSITVTNCVLRTNCAAIKLGTESIGPIRNITVSNCVIHTWGHGLPIGLYAKDGGGYENITIANIVANCEDAAFPIIIDVTPRLDPSEKAGRIRNVIIDSAIINANGRCYIEGTAAEPVENIAMTNITWNTTGGLDASGADKPAGAARVNIDPGRINHARHSAHVIAANVNGLDLRGLRLLGPDGTPATDRQLLYEFQTTRVRVDVDV